jgi:hypothetical protein
MKTLLHLLLRPWIFRLLLAGALLISLSTSIRYYREEKTAVNQLQNNLQAIRRLRRQVVAPAEGLPLLSQTRIRNPLQGYSDPTLGYVRVAEDLSSTPLGLGLTRWSLTLELNQLRPADLGDLFASLEGVNRGWWVTEAQLSATSDGLNGRLNIEALDRTKN